jgi:hypothetical protein
LYFKNVDPGDWTITTLWIHNLWEIDKFYGQLMSSFVNHKHTSLLQDQYIMKGNVLIIEAPRLILRFQTIQV